MSAHVVNGYGNDLADQPRIAVEDDDPVAGRATGELKDVVALVGPTHWEAYASRSPGPVAWPFDEHLDPLAEEFLAVLLADPVLQVQQLVVAAILDFKRHVIGV